MPKITIIRPYEWANQKKNISIYIDGNKGGRVGIDKTVQFDVQSGKHKVVLGNYWAGRTKPIEVEVSSNEDSTIRMSTSQYGLLMGPLIVFIAFTIFAGIVAIFDLHSSFIARVLIVLPISLLLYIPFISRYYMKLEELNPAKTITKEEQARLIGEIMAADEKDGLYDV